MPRRNRRPRRGSQEPVDDPTPDVTPRRTYEAMARELVIQGKCSVRILETAFAPQENR